MSSSHKTDKPYLRKTPTQTSIYSLSEKQKPSECTHELFDEYNLISCQDLYNILNGGSMNPFIHDKYHLLLIDGRNKSHYNHSHIITSTYYLTLLNDVMYDSSISNFLMIILYGYELENNKETEQLVKLQNDIQEYVAGDVLILKEGFKSFEKLYPFLCEKNIAYSVADRKNILIYPSVILDDNLYQGRGEQATNQNIVDNLRISHILNISTEHRNVFQNKIKYLQITLDDDANINIYKHFKETSDFINNAILKGGKVLVHCHQGISRSSSITLAYLMRFKKWDLETSFRTLKSRRPCSSPNAGFLKQLSDWENYLFGKKITDIEKLI